MRNNSTAVERTTTPELSGSSRQPATPPVRPLAMYLPQYHPIPENNEWWGAGFTEWTNVAKARPRFPWHQQPHLPADLGYYDLRVPEVRERQAELARQYGIHGFCYYHYWFDGRRLLERPFQEVLDSGRPDFPFCLCWANENWTRAWDGGEREVLMPQHYSREGHEAHFRWLCQAFADPRYVRAENKPIFLVYRASTIPDLPRVADLWREIARKEGIGEVLLGHVECFATEHRDPREFGFDVAVEFAPDWGCLGLRRRDTLADRWRTWLGRGSSYSAARVHEYAQVVENMLRKPPVNYPRFPGVTPSWDNSPRRKHLPVILQGASPQLYEQWLRAVVERFVPPRPGLDLLFINAWNEWGEGNHLEPCQRWGRQYLEATHRVLTEAATGPGTASGVSSRPRIAEAV